MPKQCTVSLSQKREIAFKKVGVHCHIDVYGFPTTATSNTYLRHSLKFFKVSLALLYAVISTSVPSWKQQRRRRVGFSQFVMTSVRVTMISMVFNLKVFKSCSLGSHSKKHKQQGKGCGLSHQTIQTFNCKPERLTFNSCRFAH